MHFTAYNNKYPQFSFVVRDLRPFLDAKGENQTSTVVRFENGVLDSKAQGWDLKEAEAIHKRLSTMLDTVVQLHNTEEGPQANVDSFPLQVKIKSKIRSI